MRWRQTLDIARNRPSPTRRTTRGSPANWLGEVIARLGQGACSSDADPFAGEYLVELGLQEVLAGIDAGGHRPSAFERPAHIGEQLANRLIDRHGVFSSKGRPFPPRTTSREGGPIATSQDRRSSERPMEPDERGGSVGTG